MQNKLNTTIEQIIINLTKTRISDQKELNTLIKKISCSIRIATPSRINLLKAYHNLLKKGKIKANLKLESLLKKREIRTLSGVAPIAVLTKPFPCPGKCVWCPSEKNMPKSYLPNEPAVMRAILNKFDPFKQVQMRLRALKMTGHDTDKCELIVM